MKNKLRWYDYVTAFLKVIDLCCRHGLKGADKILVDERNEIQKAKEIVNQILMKQRG